MTLTRIDGWIYILKNLNSLIILPLMKAVAAIL